MAERELEEFLTSLGLSAGGTRKFMDGGFSTVDDFYGGADEEAMTELSLTVCDKGKVRKALKTRSSPKTSQAPSPPPSDTKPRLPPKPKPPPDPNHPAHRSASQTRTADHKKKHVQQVQYGPVTQPADYYENVGVHKGITQDDNTVHYRPVTQPGDYYENVEVDEGITQDVHMTIDLQPIKDECTLLSSDPIEQYQLHLDKNSDNCDMKLRRLEYGTRRPYSKEKTILMIGESGSGKSTTIDSLLNFILGVTMLDNFRFKLVDTKWNLSQTLTADQTESQTNWITSYTIHEIRGSSLPFTLNIVDTPGFGDTRGISRDKETAAQFKELFSSNGLQTLDAVCLVMKASTNRINATVSYVTECVLSVFGKDIKENICLLTTFADGDVVPTVIKDLADKMNLKGNTYYQWNNRWLTCQRDTGMVSHLYQISKDSYFKFIDFLHEQEPKSLSMSCKVLEERSRLEEAVDMLQGLISFKLGEIVSLDQVAAKIQQQEDTIIEWYRPGKTKVMTVNDNMNCFMCQLTCRVDKKRGLLKRIFSGNKKCRVCKCPTKEHEFEKHQYTISHVIQKSTIKEIKQQYGTQDDALTAITAKKEELIQRVKEAMQRMKDSMDILNKIALRPTISALDDYVDVVIKTEEKDREPQYENRIRMLKILKKQNKLINLLAKEPTSTDEYI